MNVLFFIGSLTSGGAERVTVSLANYLVRKGHQVSLVTLHDTERDFYILDSKVDRVCLNLFGENHSLLKLTANFRRLRSLRRVIRSKQPDIVVGMMPTATILCILACIGLKARVIGSERNYPGRKRIGRAWCLLRRLLYRFADAHIAQTREGADWIIRYASAKNVNVIPNSIAWPIPAGGSSIDPALYVSPERRLILAVGSKAEQKGFDLLLSAYISIAHNLPDYDLAIVGLAAENDEKTTALYQLQAQAKSAGLVERIHFPGKLGNVGEWYERADLFVLSSRYEGFPNVLLEAMAAGCPCIAFDCDTGPRDIINHNVNGLLVKVGDVSSLALCIKDLANSPEKSHSIAQQAKKVIENYAETEVFDKWIKLMKSLG